MCENKKKKKKKMNFFPDQKKNDGTNLESNGTGIPFSPSIILPPALSTYR